MSYGAALPLPQKPLLCGINVLGFRHAELDHCNAFQIHCKGYGAFHKVLHDGTFLLK